MKRILALFLLGSILLGLVGCTQTPQTDKLKIAVSIPPLATFVQAVVGEMAEVQVMVPPGYSPETYSPTPKELASAQDAAIYFSVGVPAEREAILPHLNAATEIVQLDKIVDENYPPLLIGEERDPHIWLSPKRARVMVSAMISTLCERDPDHADLYHQNGHTYLSELGFLELEIQETLVDLENRTFLVFHPAFGYFADDYGLTMLALEEEGKEATPQHMQAMVDLAREQNVRVLFYQEEIDSRQADAFARELSGRTVALDPLSADYSNNLRHMANTIKEAVGN